MNADAFRRCSFCNKNQQEVRRLVAGRNVYICDECSDIVQDVVSGYEVGAAERNRLLKELCELTVARTFGQPNEAERMALQQRIDELVDSLMPRRRYRAGQVVNHYRLLRIVGSGNFATVWEGVVEPPTVDDVAVQQSTGLPALLPAKAAVKVFDVEKLGQGIMLWRFQRGIKAMEYLSSLSDVPSSVIKFYGAAEDRLSFTMEFLSGGDLQNIGERGWSLKKKLSCFDKVCTALSFAHKHGIIHRDVKPANVVVDAVGEPVLTDFDIADLLFAPTKSVHSAALGTPQFAAPEQLAAPSVEAKPTADVYSLGKLLFFLITETAPPLGSSAEKYLPGYLERTPLAFRAIIARATQEAPQDRYQTVDELRYAVASTPLVSDITNESRAADSQQIEAPAPQPFRDLRSRNAKLAVGVGAAVGIATLLFTMTLIVMSVYGKTVPPDSRFLVVIAFALTTALSAGFLGGGAIATGHLPLPLAKAHPVEFAISSGAAIFIIVLIVGRLLFL